MSIDARHWGTVVARVTQHARELHPRNEGKQEKLIKHLLGLADTDDKTRIRRKLSGWNFLTGKRKKEGD